jgi:hypothetical protein
MRRDRIALGTLAAALVVAGADGHAQPAAQEGESAVAAVLRRAGIAPTEGALAGTDPKARAAALDALERSYPLPRSVLDRENSPPPDREAIMDRLGLVRRPGVPVTDLSGAPPTARQITDALKPR